MGNAIEQKLVELISQFQQGASDFVSSAKVALPEVTETALRVVQWDGAWHLLMGAAFLVASGISWKVSRWGIKRLEARDIKNEGLDEYMPPADTFIIWGGRAISLAMVIAAMFQLFNMWNWVALFDPKAAFAHKILVMVLDKMGGK